MQRPVCTPAAAANEKDKNRGDRTWERGVGMALRP